MRCVNKLQVTRCDNLVVIDIEANAFLHHMVRNIAGVLADIGAGAKPVSWTADLIALRDRSAASVTAPPSGLYLTDVIYLAHQQIPKGPVYPPILAGYFAP